MSFIKRQDKPNALWLIKNYNILKDSQIKAYWYNKNSVTSIRNKSYWNYNNLDHKTLLLWVFTQKDLVQAKEKLKDN